MIWTVAERSEWRYNEAEVPAAVKVLRNQTRSSSLDHAVLSAEARTKVSVPSYSQVTEMRGAVFVRKPAGKDDSPVHSLVVLADRSGGTRAWSYETTWHLPRYFVGWLTSYSLILVRLRWSLIGQCNYDHVSMTIDVSKFLVDAVVSNISLQGSRSNWSGMLAVLGGYKGLSALLPQIRVTIGGKFDFEALVTNEQMRIDVEMQACTTFNDILPVSALHFP